MLPQNAAAPACDRKVPAVAAAAACDRKVPAVAAAAPAVGHKTSVGLLSQFSQFYSRTGKYIKTTKYLNDDEILGSGAYAIVYLGTCSDNPKKKVAIKVLDMRSRGLFSNEFDCRRILRELMILRQLQHPNVIPLSDIIPPQDPNNFNELALVFPRAEFDLSTVLKHHSVLTMAQVQYMMYQILSALNHCHQCNVMHRDLKPDNILLNSTCKLQICDFNLARTYHDEPEPASDEPPQSSPKLQRTFTVKIVSPYYRAPEICMKDARYTQAIDIWSAGAIMGELLHASLADIARRPLFVAEDRPEAQLAAMFAVIGTPSPADVANIAVDRYRAHVAQRCQFYPTGSRLMDLFPRRAGASDEENELRDAARDLLSRLLAFDPKNRPTAQEALEHSFFDTLHPTRRLPPSSGKAHIYLTNLETMELTDDNLRATFIDIVREFYPEYAPPAAPVMSAPVMSAPVMSAPTTVALASTDKFSTPNYPYSIDSPTSTVAAPVPTVEAPVPRVEAILPTVEPSASGELISPPASFCFPR
jgi:mitogen-activated protein kinase 1/3